MAMSGTDTRCIECGGTVGSLNEDEEGVPCPACAERLLETLPGVFHSPWGSQAGIFEQEQEQEPEPEHVAESDALDATEL